MDLRIAPAASTGGLFFERSVLFCYSHFPFVFIRVDSWLTYIPAFLAVPRFLRVSLSGD